MQLHLWVLLLECGKEMRRQFLQKAHKISDTQLRLGVKLPQPQQDLIPLVQMRTYLLLQQTAGLGQGDAIGNVSGSMFSGTYPHNENCLSHSRCVTFGYNVAKTLAAL